jgi:hypothetical protein
MVPLGHLLQGTIASAAHGVSGDGSVVVGGEVFDNCEMAFRWTADEGMVPRCSGCCPSRLEAGAS